MNRGDTAAVEFRDVSKWYGAITALMGITFTIGREVVGLVGRNGAGKSTLLRVGAGLLRPSQGEARVLGLPATDRATRCRLGFCPDTERLYEGLTGREFVAWMLRLHGAPRTAARARAGEVLDELGLGAAMERAIRTYSKGMRQRVRLAQALAHRPAAVLLDEPMTGLDPVARSELGAVIRALPARGVGVLVSSHVLHELEAIVDRVVFVHQGRVLAQGRVADLRDQLPGQLREYRLAGGQLRALAARVLALPQVVGVRVEGAALRVTVADVQGFHGAITALAAAWSPGISELEPLDEDLAFMFQRYLA
jgi:ABC-2 type transport system ATP-binding protein